MPSISALDHTYDTAAARLPHDVAQHAGEDEPVLAARIIDASTKRTSPLTGVQARPVATPVASRSATSSTK